MQQAIRTVHVGVIGLGTVGGGTVRLIQKHRDSYLDAYGIDIEAARGGGIPTVSALEHALVGNKALTIAGIVNGTTNYILSRMDAEGLDFAAAVNGAMNAVYMVGDAVGETMFYGAGAGAFPTASAVVGDILELARPPSPPLSRRGCPYRASAMCAAETTGSAAWCSSRTAPRSTTSPRPAPSLRSRAAPCRWRA